MTVKQLYDELGNLMIEYPSVKNDDIFIHTWCTCDSDEVLDTVEKLDIEYDLNDIGRWVTLRDF